MLGKIRSKEKLHGVKYHKVYTKYGYKNILLNAKLSNILNFTGGRLSQA